LSRCNAISQTSSSTPALRSMEHAGTKLRFAGTPAPILVALMKINEQKESWSKPQSRTTEVAGLAGWPEPDSLFFIFLEVVWTSE
jgi:hypothetical protein